MKITKKPDKKTKEFHQKLLKTFKEPDEYISLAITYLGIASLMGDHIMKSYENPFDCPVKLQYAICQLVMHQRMIKSILNGETEGIDLRHMPTDGDSWKTDEDFEKRAILVIKTLYEQYKEEGKI